jgi:tetratricopeptide (TPR) repeat protein
LANRSLSLQAIAMRGFALSVVGVLVCLGSIFGVTPVRDLPVALAQVGKPEGFYYKSWAIVIGIENYLLAPVIPGAISDAKNVAKAFRKLGFDEVVELYDKDATSRRLHQLLNDVLPRKVGRMDRLVIFYSGHAGVSREAEGVERGYLVPLDAPMNTVAKAVTVDHLKEFTRRSASKHTLLILDAPVFGWETTVPQPLSLEGRVAPEADTEKRAVQVISAADRGEVSGRMNGQSLFVQAVLEGLTGAADRDRNGWLMASELGSYIAQRVDTNSSGTQHPTTLRIDGDGDTVLIEGRKAAFMLGAGPQTPAERQQVARAQYERAFELLQERKHADEALERLNRAIEYDPSFGDAYVLKSYLLCEVLPNLDEALASGRLAVKYAPNNPDSFYTLGLIHEKRANYEDAEAALLQALNLKPDHQDVYFSLGLLYADHLNNQSKSVQAFRRYLELGGSHARARAAVAEADKATKP